MRQTLVLLSMVSAMLLALPLEEAQAGDNDFRLNRLASCRGDTTPGPAGGCVADPDDNAFLAFSKSLGRVVASGGMTSAETLGQEGFSFGVESRIVSADSGDHWRVLNGTKDGETSPPLFSLLQVHARKGLPFSFEIDSTLSWLLDSELLWIGGGLKLALLESINQYVPDLAIRGHGGSLVGAPDMTLSTAGVSISISKVVGIGGILSVAPYAGIDMLWIFASSRVLDADPAFGATPSAGYAPEFVFANETQSAPRAFGGLKFVVTHFTLGIEVMSDLEVSSLGFNIGGDF